MAVLRYQIVSTCSKGAVNKLVVIRISSNNTHTEMRVDKLNVLLVEDKKYNILCHSRSYLLAQYLLILIKNLVGHTKVIASSKKCVPNRTIGTFSSNYLKQTIGVNYYGIHQTQILIIIRCAEVGTAQFLQFFLIPLAALPKSVHFVVYLFGIESSQLFPELLQSSS